MLRPGYLTLKNNEIPFFEKHYPSTFQIHRLYPGIENKICFKHKFLVYFKINVKYIFSYLSHD